MISIILLHKNDSRFLIRFLNSVIPQLMLKRIEIILVDDNSSKEEFKNILEINQEEYPFKIIQNKGSGVKDATLTGCKHARFDHVSCWSVDDVMLPNYVFEMNQAIRKYKAGLYLCASEVVRENEIYNRRLFSSDALLTPDYLVKLYKHYGKCFNFVGSVIKKSHILNCEKFAHNTNFDCLYNFYAMFSEGVYYVDKPLVRFYSYAESYGSKGKMKDIKTATKLAIQRYSDNQKALQRAIESGIFDSRRAKFCLWLITKLPYFIREMIYDWYYSYNQKQEKL